MTAAVDALASTTTLRMSGTVDTLASTIDQSMKHYHEIMLRLVNAKALTELFTMFIVAVHFFYSYSKKSIAHSRARPVILALFSNAQPLRHYTPVILALFSNAQPLHRYIPVPAGP